MNENFYLLLNLSVEHFVSGQAASDALKKQLSQWNSNNNTENRDKAEKYGKPIAEAIADPTEWKKQFDAAVVLFDREITDWVNTVGGKEYITPEEIENRAKSITLGTVKNYKVDADFLRKYIAGKFPDLEIRSGEAPKAAPKSSKKLEDYKPEGYQRFKNPAKSCSQLFCADYYQFLQQEQDTKLAFSRDTDAAVCVKTAEDIAKKWRAHKENAQKSAVETLCTTIIGHFAKPNDPQNQEEYNKFLIYEKLDAILKGLNQKFKGSNEGEKVLNETAKASYIRQLTEQISSADDAESILTAFCAEKGIQLPKKIAQQGLCPFCDHVFPKEGGKMPQVCPVCRKSFMLTCPKCKKTANYAEVRNCGCGFNLDQYPRIAKKCEEALSFINTLNFQFAESRIAEIKSVWAGFPMLQTVEQELSAKRRDAGSLAEKMNLCLKERRYQAAQKEYASLCRAVPGYADTAVADEINHALQEAHQVYQEALKAADPTEKLKKLLHVTRLVADHSDAIRALGSIQPEPVSGLICTAEQSGGFVDLTWTSKNPEGTAEYVILRKPHSAPVSTTDGKIASVSECAYCDRTPERGIPYFYAVFAQRGANHSAMVTAAAPVLIFPEITDMHILPAESAVQVTWNTNIGELDVEVFRVNAESDRKYESGTRIKNATKNSFEDTGLKLGQRYYYNVFLTKQLAGKKLVSSAFSVAAAPVKISEPLEYLLEQDDSGKVILKLKREPDPDETVAFYRCERPSVLPNDRITTVPKLISELGMQPLGITAEKDGSYSFKPAKNEKGYIYAVAVRGDTAVIGQEDYYENLETIEVVSQRSDGIHMFLELRTWPENINTMTVVFRQDKYPVSPTEAGGSKIQVNALTYKAEHIKIPYQGGGVLYAAGFVRGANGLTAIFRTKIGQEKKLTVSYYFTKGLLGGRKVVITLPEAAALPELMLVYRESYPPSDPADGTVLAEFSSSDQKRSFEFAVKNKPNARKGAKLCGKLFLRDQSLNDRYQIMIAEGHTMEL